MLMTTNNPRPLRRQGLIWAGVGVAALVGISVVGSITGRDDGGEKKTLVEAACGMLRDGESADFTYQVAKDLASDHPYTYRDSAVAARLAVDQAVAQGCS